MERLIRSPEDVKIALNSLRKRYPNVHAVEVPADKLSVDVLDELGLTHKATYYGALMTGFGVLFVVLIPFTAGLAAALGAIVAGLMGTGLVTLVAKGNELVARQLMSSMRIEGRPLALSMQMNRNLTNLDKMWLFYVPN